MSCAFPAFFPTGATDFLAPRPVGVTIGNYLKYLMMYGSARHPRVCYFALNTGGLSRLDVSVCHKAQLLVEELRAMVGQAFSNHVLQYATSLHGTRQYWF